MKKLIITIIFIIAWNNINAQFTFAKGDFINTYDGKDYIVVQYPGANQDLLYKTAKTYIVSAFNSAKDILSENYPTSMSVLAGEEFTVRMMGFCLLYKVAFTFKDEKIRYVFSFVSYSVSSGPIQHIGKEVGLFNKKGNAKGAYSKDISLIEECINNTFSEMNNYIQEILTSGDTDW